MTQLKEIEEPALQLPQKDRRVLADHPLSSLDDKPLSNIDEA